MAVPAHDERDFEFAKQFDLPIVCGRRADRRVADASGARRDAGRRWPRRSRAATACAVNSGPFDGLTHAGVQGADHRGPRRAGPRPRRRSTTSSATGSSAGSISGASRSRSCTSDAGDPTGRACRESMLPVELPGDDRLRAEIVDDAATSVPTPPLAKRRGLDWRRARPRRRAEAYRRETNTMPQWAGSCWYYLRFLDPKNDEARLGRRRAYWRRPWMPVDLYVGGAEHAVLHLLYARFWHKVLFDLGPRLDARAVPEARQPGLHPGVRVHRRRGVLRRGERGRRARRRGVLPRGRAGRPRVSGRWARA